MNLDSGDLAERRVCSKARRGKANMVAEDDTKAIAEAKKKCVFFFFPKTASACGNVFKKDFFFS